MLPVGQAIPKADPWAAMQIEAAVPAPAILAVGFGNEVRMPTDHKLAIYHPPRP
jgi:hypothetical protein